MTRRAVLEKAHNVAKEDVCFMHGNADPFPPYIPIITQRFRPAGGWTPAFRDGVRVLVASSTLVIQHIVHSTVCGILRRIYCDDF
jgi:hypothetical protein